MATGRWIRQAGTAYCPQSTHLRSDMTTNTESALTFPCDFPLKIMGRASDDFDVLVVDIVLRHVGSLREGAISMRASSGGSYVSVTVTVQAESQAQLDALYRELSGHERILMVL